jgi:hypothetical protein
LLKSRSRNFLRETSRFYCVSGALRGLRFPGGACPRIPPPRILTPSAFASPPNQKIPPRSLEFRAESNWKHSSHIRLRWHYLQNYYYFYYTATKINIYANIELLETQTYIKKQPTTFYLEYQKTMTEILKQQAYVYFRN